MANVPTVGRKMHFFPANDASVQKFDDQPIDATIVYVRPKANEAHHLQVNLLVADHAGTVQVKTSVPIINEGDEIPEHSFYARWPAISTPTEQSAAPAVDTAMAPQAELAQVAVSQPSGQPEQNESSTVATAADATVATSDASAEPLTSDSAAPLAESQTESASAPAPEIAPTAEVAQPVTYDFGVVLNALKQGKAATRKGWNGQGMFVYLVPAASYKAQTGIAKKVFGEDAMVPYNAYFALKGVDGTVSTWVPSVRDCLAEDWEISQ